MAEPSWTVSDKRMGRTASGLFLPKTASVGEKNNVLASQLNKDKVSSMRRTGSNMQMAMPKQRVPMGSLMDKGIPYDTTDPKQLSEARSLCRLYYRLHDLVPLLIDMYAQFPLNGLEFVCRDSLIENFYSDMFLNDLSYEEFLPTLAREYFVAGEVSALAHFDESLGVWSSEEIIDPDMIRVSKSVFVQEERVQLLVKDMVERLRTGPQGMPESEESPSERLERVHQYCCVPGTKVLTSDLRWVPVESLAVGDPIMGFDEYPRPGRSHKREWVPTRVTATSTIVGNTYRINTTGPTVECTDQHRWLSIPQNRWTTIPVDTTRDEEFYPTYDWKGLPGRETKRSRPWVRRPCHNPNCSIPMELCPSAATVTKFCSKACSNAVKNRSYSSGKRSGQLMWLRADEMRPGDKIMFLGQWDADDSRDAGWMGGFLDGEGTLGRDGGISFGQNSGLVLDRALEILDANKFSYSTWEGKPHKNTGKVCTTVRISGGLSETIRALSIFRPIRLLQSFPEKIHGKEISKGWVTVTEVAHVGEQEVVALATSSKTLIAEGMLSHNTELVKHYPEFVRAADQDDGLDISDALVSRLVNRINPWDLRGTPHLMRSFRTLMMEESLNAAQDSVCLPAGSPVLTSRGVKSIEDVTAADEVLTHCGRYRRVVEPMVREADEPGVTIRWWYDQPLTLTGEHPVYVRRPINMPSHHYHGQRHNDWAEGFIPAREVRTYDQVLHPSSPDSGKEYVSVWEHLDQKDWVVYDPSDVALGMTGHDWYDNAATQTKRVSRNRVAAVLNHCEASPGDILRHNRFRAKTQHFAAEYKLTEDLLWLIGLHVADGSAQINNSSGAPHGSVVITLGDHEGYLADRAVRVFSETFGITPTVTPCWGGKKAIKVSANSLPLAMWFRKMCGVNGSKSFPHWAFGLTVDQTNALIQGWMDGDGTTDNVRTLGSSAYRQLQESAAWLMRRSGLITSSRRGKRQGGFSGLGYQYTVTTVKTPRRAYPADQGGYWVEVRSVEHHQVAQTVYNLEVEEDHSYCAPIAVHNCDRLYAPMILATLGMENLGDGEPWIPSQSDLDQVRDDMQTALAADFKLMVHNMGLKVESVFGRESVPRFDSDYDRITAKLLQAWGIGEALVAGGSGGAYASSALNREVCEQLMLGMQRKVTRHIIKRMEIIAEAQEHYDYEQKGGYRRPLYREIVEVDPETGEEYIRKVPKLLIPEVKWSVLNLRDEATERAFVQQLKAAGVPVSDKMLAINLPVNFKEELERSAEETVQKGLATSQAMDKLQKLCDAQKLPYPPELAQQLGATLQLRQALSQTEMLEGQTEMQEMQMKQMGAAGQMGLIPGVPAPPPPEPEDASGGPGAPAQAGVPSSTPPQGGVPTSGPPMTAGPVVPNPVELPRNRQRPEESDEMRAGTPRAASLKKGPSSYGRSRYASEDRVKKAVRRVEAIQKHKAANRRVEDLVEDPEFYDALNAQQYEDQIRADFPEILNGGAAQSKKILDDLLNQYAEIFGTLPDVPWR